MSGPDRTEYRRRRRGEVVRVLAGLAWLVLALVVFWKPLAVMLSPTVGNAGLSRVLEVSAEPGFVLNMTSSPPGGRLWVDGIDLGAVPSITNVVCEEGQKVLIEVKKAGRSTWRRKIACRDGSTLVATARLGK